jgi:hypothetical protein
VSAIGYENRIPSGLVMSVKPTQTIHECPDRCASKPSAIRYANPPITNRTAPASQVNWSGHVSGVGRMSGKSRAQPPMVVQKANLRKRIPAMLHGGSRG